MLNTRIVKEGSIFSERRLIDSGNSDYDPLGFLAAAVHLHSKTWAVKSIWINETGKEVQGRLIKRITQDVLVGSMFIHQIWRNE